MAQIEPSNRGKVAVIMRTKNRPLLLRRAIRSVTSQTATDWVLSIVNDGGDAQPVDKLLEEVAPGQADRIVVTHHPVSAGMEAASNAGIRAVESEYCVIHDDDDAWHPTFLERMLEVFESKSLPKSVYGLASRSEVVIESVADDQVIEHQRFPWFRNETPITLWNLCGGNLFPPIAFLYRRSVYDSIGLYEESLPVLGDWEFNLRFMRKFDILRVPQDLTYYHLRAKATDEAYLGTLNHQRELHETHRDLIENRLLREDMEQGKIGFGLIMNLSRGIRESVEGISNNSKAIKEQSTATKEQSSAIKNLLQERLPPQLPGQVAHASRVLAEANIHEMAARLELDTQILVDLINQNLMGKLDESREILIGLNEAKSKAARIAKKLPFAKSIAKRARKQP